MMDPLNSLIAIVSCCFCFIGLFSLGSWVLAFMKCGTEEFHFRIVVGLGVFYFFFYTSSWILSAQWVGYASSMLLLFCIFTQYDQWPKLRRRVPYLFFGILVLTFLPYFFRMFSPPVSEDGLSFYLPNIAWIHTHGLSYNPYLTNYTTMPLGVEYLFSVPFGWAGYQGVVLMDALGTLALIHLLYQSSRRYMNRTKSQLVVVAALLIKGTFFFVFASGKIDTWNTYALMTGLFLFIRASQKKDWQSAFVVFSIALGLKFTNYILLLFPLILCWILVVKNQGIKKAFLLAFVPLFFVGSVLVRNYILVNNPLAPLVELEGQSRFVAIHQEKEAPSNSLTSFFETWEGDKISAVVQFSTRYSQVFLVVVSMMLGWFFWKKKSKVGMELKWAGVAIVMMYLPWILFLGNSTQPLRFIWAPLMLTIWAFVGLIDSLEKSGQIRFKMPGLALYLICTFFLIATVYRKHAHYIPDFFALQNQSLASWYSQVGRDHYALSYRFKELGLHHAKVDYRAPVALGAFALDDYGNIPTQEEFYMLRNDSAAFEYVLDFGMHKLAAVPAEKVVIQSGEYFVYRH